MNKSTHSSLLIIALVCLNSVNSSSAGVLHWLSQVEADVGPIVNNFTFTPKISTNGRYITFKSLASNLVTNDTNGTNDVILKDLLTGQTELVTTLLSGQQINGFRNFTNPTSDGRYVAFSANGDELPNGSSRYHIYLKDLITGTLSNLSEYDSGLYFDTYELFHLSDDAQFITFSTNVKISPSHTDIGNRVYRKNLATADIEMLSISVDGATDANGEAILISVSDNNRYTLFYSSATNLTNDVINNTGDNLFLRDTVNNTTSLINITPNGTASDFENYIYQGDVSNTGAVIFTSTQSDLVVADNNSRTDVFYYNNGDIERINLDPNGNEISSSSFLPYVAISGDGTRMVFDNSSSQLADNDNNSTEDIFSYLVASGELSLVSKNIKKQSANSYSIAPSISLNGNRIVFSSLATDLTTTPSSAIHQEIYAHQFSTQTTQKISVPVFNPNTIISAVMAAYSSNDQLSVVYSTRSNNLSHEPLNLTDSHVYLLDRNTNSHHVLANNGVASDISPSGQYVVFTSEYAQPEGTLDLDANYVFLYNHANGNIIQIDEGAYPKVNDEGKVVFSSEKAISNDDINNTNDIYYFNPSTQNISLVSQGLDGLATTSGLLVDIGGSGNNTWVVFDSVSDVLVADDFNGFKDVFMKKIPNGPVFRVSQTAAGLEGNSSSYNSSISNNGDFVSFITYASNLTNDDYSTAGRLQIMHYDRVNTLITLASKNDDGLPLNSDRSEIYLPSVSDSGRYVAYMFNDSTSDGIDFIGDDDGLKDIILSDILSQTSQIVSISSNGLNSTAYANSITQLTEDLSLSPPLVGVTFTASSPTDLTGISNHPGHSEAFLYQQGGPALDFNIQVIGSGAVNGTSITTCQSLCNFSFALGTELSVTAAPDPGMEFRGWQLDFISLGADCNDNSNPCEVIMDRSKTLTVVFFDPNDVIFADGFE